MRCALAVVENAPAKACHCRCGCCGLQSMMIRKYLQLLQSQLFKTVADRLLQLTTMAVEKLLLLSAADAIIAPFARALAAACSVNCHVHVVFCVHHRGRFPERSGRLRQCSISLTMFTVDFAASLRLFNRIASCRRRCFA